MDDDSLLVGLMASVAASGAHTGAALIPMRVATTCTADTADAITDAVVELVREVHERNDFGAGAVRVVLFSTTPDLRALKPARAAREAGWTAAEYLCLAEMPTEDDLPRCLRALLFVLRAPGADPLKPVYLREAAVLRP